MPRNPMKIPVITPILYNKATIFIFCLIPLFILNSTASPTPAPTNNPEINVEIGRAHV